MEQQHNKNMVVENIREEEILHGPFFGLRTSASVDVKKLKDAGLCTVEAVAYSSRKELLIIKGISEIIKLSSDEAGRTETWAITQLYVRTPRTDVKEFFRQARSTSFYKQFGAFLVNIEELNSQNRTRELVILSDLLVIESAVTEKFGLLVEVSSDLMIAALEEMALKHLQQSVPALPVIPYVYVSVFSNAIDSDHGPLNVPTFGIHTLNSSLGSFSFVVLQFAVRYLHGCRHSLPDGLMRVADVMVDGEIVVAAG
ncbi:hypothetical protein C5167_019892 [Papaver somniferum]|uniref:At4g15545-like C-terminal domain-containing protein n=1 Tax=Papaver somniferum TaxID=3469 RepID=A0A4Y7ITK6_PAPSO|nr:hypothetical protein C5167_019892 [Papaver somniferum]